jgi:hypothetical protein
VSDTTPIACRLSGARIPWGEASPASLRPRVHTLMTCTRTRSRPSAAAHRAPAFISSASAPRRIMRATESSACCISLAPYSAIQFLSVCNLPVSDILESVRVLNKHLEPCAVSLTMTKQICPSGTLCEREPRVAQCRPRHRFQYSDNHISQAPFGSGGGLLPVMPSSTHNQRQAPMEISTSHNRTSGQE